MLASMDPVECELTALPYARSTGRTGDILLVDEAIGARVYCRHVRLFGQMVEAIALKSCGDAKA